MSLYLNQDDEKQPPNGYIPQQPPNGYNPYQGEPVQLGEAHHPQGEALHQQGEAQHQQGEIQPFEDDDEFPPFDERDEARQQGEDSDEELDLSNRDFRDFLYYGF